MTLDADVVRARCAEIEDSVQRLQQIARLPFDQFLASQDTQDIACYRLLVAIEAALALCYHVSARQLHKAPEDYAGCFAALRDGGVIPAQLAERLQRMARFRNLLVHVYWKIDYRQVHDVLKQNLNDLQQFASAIAALTQP